MRGEEVKVMVMGGKGRGDDVEWGKGKGMMWDGGCYNFLPFSHVLPCLSSTISLLPLCSFA